MSQTLALSTLLRLLGCMVIVIVPHFLRIPVWESLLVTSILIWRGLASYRHWPNPPAWLRAILGFLVFLGVLVSYGRINGQHAGVALLVVMTALKLTELNTRRDNVIVAFVCYFLLITHFLFSQELGMIVYLLVAMLLITAVLVELSHPQGPLPFKVILRGGGVLVLHSIPLMVILFILFPRLPGPLWGLPSDVGAGRTGLSDKMEPGSISALSHSEAVAFRVNFIDPPPEKSKLYWRGPTFWFFDGRAWTAGGDADAFPSIRPENLGTATRYEVTLEPHGQPWLLALDVPVEGGPPTTIRSLDYQLLSPRPVNDRILYLATSYTNYRIQPNLWPRLRERALQLPNYGNPRTRALMKQWRDEGLDDAAIISRVLHMFREQEFVYTLEPPLLEKNSVDEFLFGTRRGFCEHYSSAFTFMMRAAGIPARVVTGYLGGELNPSGGYYIIRQSDSHAWSEVWLQDRGWVRMDPTAAVAPQRIELNMAEALSPAERAAMSFAARTDNKMLNMVRLRWDWVNASWNRWVLAYGPDLQAEFLKRFGLPDWQAMILALTGIMFAFLTALGALILWQARPAIGQDPVVRHWDAFCRRMAQHKLERLPYEGPRDYAHRIVRARPDLGEQVLMISGLYIDLRYAGINDPTIERRLAERVKRFKP